MKTSSPTINQKIDDYNVNIRDNILSSLHIFSKTSYKNNDHGNINIKKRALNKTIYFQIETKPI